MSRHQQFALVIHGREGTAAGEDCLAIRPRVGFFGRAFRLGGRVRESEDDRLLVDPRHGLDHGLREGLARAGYADDAGGFQHFDGRQEVADKGVFMRVRPLVRHQIGAFGHYQPLGVHEPAAQPRFGLAQPFLHHRSHNQVTDADAGLAGAVEEELVVAQLAAGQPQRRVETGQHDARGALDVVVEGADAVAVVVQQPEGVGVAEVLKLDDGSREDLLHSQDELFHQRVVGFAPLAIALEADVKRIVQQFLIVGAHVQRDGQALLGMDAGAGGVERQLAHGDAHAVGSLVAQPQNALAIGDDDDTHVVIMPVAQDVGHAATILQADEHSLRLLKNVAIFLARLADGRGVDDGHQLVQIVHHDAEEQGGVAIQQANQVAVLGQRCWHAAHVFQHARHLVVQGRHTRWQQAAQPERIALGFAEAGTLV